MALCYAPFLHKIIYTDGTSGLCCVADKESYLDKDYSDWNGKDYQNIRSHMINEKVLPEVCNKCKSQEEVEDYPYKEVYNKLYERLGRPRIDIKTGTALDVPVSLDLRMNNLCNLSCRMCGPSASSQLEKEQKKHPELWPTIENYRSNWLTYSASDIIDNAGAIIDLRLLGGEPTVQPEAKAILNKLIEIGNTNIDLRITTNGTNINKEFYDMISKFTGFVSIAFSIDGWDKTHEYIRGPAADFKTIWKNLKKVSQLSNVSQITIQQTITILNVFDWWKLHENNDSGCFINADVTNMPPKYACANMPDKWKKHAIDLARHNMSIANRKLTSNITPLILNEGDPSLLKGVLQYTDLMDSVRGQHAKDHCPITYKMLEEIG